MIDHYREEKHLTANQADMDVYESMIPEDHKLCQLVEAVDFEAFRKIVESAYSDKGQPTGHAMIAFKLEVLKYFYNLSDREVFNRANTDVAFRWFLKIPIRKLFTDHTLLTLFRSRMGKERYQQLFHQLVSQARQAGLVKDQLRLKDATHVLANISIPSTLALLSQIRERLLKLIRQVDAEAANGYDLATQNMRAQTIDANDAIRINSRVQLLDDVLLFAQELLENSDKLPIKIKEELEESVELAAKILEQKKEKKAKREIRSMVDPDAMRGKHGDYYDGYMLDVSMDADSEFITSMDVLIAGGNEALGAVELIKQEREAHGNSPREISIDGAGFNGAMIHELESEEIGMEVYTPPKQQVGNMEIGSEKFELIQTEDGKPQVRCPQGNTSKYTERDGENSTIFRFPKNVCESCPLFEKCCGGNKESRFGRTVRKNIYQADYDRVRQRSQTERFQEIRRRHPAIERKLNECVNHHGARHARYRGLDKVPIQMFGVGLAVNMKRFIKLAVGNSAAQASNRSLVPALQ